MMTKQPLNELLPSKIIEKMAIKILNGGAQNWETAMVSAIVRYLDERVSPSNAVESHEYQCVCCHCQEIFTGDKREVCCPKCAKQPPALDSEGEVENSYKEGHQEGFNVGLNEAKIRFHQAIDPCIMGDNSKYFINKAYKSMFNEEYLMEQIKEKIELKEFLEKYIPNREKVPLDREKVAAALWESKKGDRFPDNEKVMVMEECYREADFICAKFSMPDKKESLHKENYGSWNIEELDKGIRICKGGHEKHIPCKWEYFSMSDVEVPKLNQINDLVSLKMSQMLMDNTPDKLGYTKSGAISEAILDLLQKGRK